MTAGFLLSLLLGVVWAALGASVAQARRKGCPICCFYTVGTATAALLAWCALGFRMPGSAGELRLLLPYLTAAAFFNSLGQMIAMYNLKASGRVLAYALPQTNFIFPFLFAGLFLGGIISLWNLIGIVLIVAGICLSANGRQDKEKKSSGVLLSGRELLLGTAASFSCGLSQIALLLAVESSETSAALKSALFLTVSTLFYALGMIRSGRPAPELLRKTLGFGIVWGVLALLSYRILFGALEIMEKFHRSGVVFAISCSGAIIFFWLFSALKLCDRVSSRQLLILGLILAGILAVRLG